MLRRAKMLSSSPHPVLRITAAGMSIAGLIALGRLATGRSLVLGSGYPAIAWSLEPHHAVGIILSLFVLRAFATAGAVAGGGAGGLFVPLVVQGALLGAAAGSLFGVRDTPLFPVLGVAAFLGAGYRVPLAAVMFVAESTGRPGFVVPGLIAAASAQLVMGRDSISTYQRSARTGILERRVGLPVSSVLRTDAATVPPDATLEEVFSHHIVSVRLLVVPVVDGNDYLGMLHLHDLVGVPRIRWADMTVAEIMRVDAPVGDVTWTLGQTLAALEQGDIDRLAITDHGAFVGVVTTGELLKLDEILDHTGESPRDG
jgi:CBS domain-containing protein